MAQMNEVAAQIMEHLCSHDWHGYTQGNRWGDGTTETLDIDGHEYVIVGGDRDCSSAVISAYNAAGLGTSATYTGNMRSAFVATGLFEVRGMDYVAQRGDVYLNDANHTAMCVSAEPDVLAEFSISENGTIYGNVGDQTGSESHIAPYYDYPWDCILRFTGGEAETPNVSPTPREIVYRVSTDEAGERWHEKMIGLHDTSGFGDDFAGSLGSPIRWLAMSFPGWYQVRNSSGVWLEPVRGYDIDDLENGCAGDGTPITGVRAYYETQNPAETGWKAIRYEARAMNAGWLGTVTDLACDDGCGDDYAGNGDAIDAFRAYLVNA